MKSALLLLSIFAIVATSCTSAYKTGQTPDDVYYSPLPPGDDYVRVEKDDRGKYRYSDDYYDDRYLRMKVRNRYLWNDLNDWYYYERYGSVYNYYYGSYYNPYNNWHYYYNPYGFPGNYAYGNPKNYVYKPQIKPRAFSLAGYTNTNTNNRNAGIILNSKTPSRINLNSVYNNNNRNSRDKGLNNTIRSIFNSGNNNSSGNSRTYNPSSSSSNSRSSGNSSSSSGGGVSRPTRKNN
ncbi:MAG: hypothetical protein KDB99_16015 [Chitinophagaceae bacterium]|nr:hypothetical protein [Chitinophagaceae bacterium]MCB9056011.1 hypothetical protein [Chitinophagales bacterium]